MKASERAPAAVRGQDGTAQLIYLYLATSKWERTNRASCVVTSHGCHRPAIQGERKAGRAGQPGLTTAMGTAVASPSLTSSGVSACCSDHPGGTMAEPRHRARHISTDFLPSMAEYNQILSQPQSCRKRSFSLLAAPIFFFFFLNSPSFEKQAKAIFASAPHIPLMSEMTSVLTRRYFYI